MNLGFSRFTMLLLLGSSLAWAPGPSSLPHILRLRTAVNQNYMCAATTEQLEPIGSTTIPTHATYRALGTNSSQKAPDAFELLQRAVAEARGFSQPQQPTTKAGTTSTLSPEGAEQPPHLLRATALFLRALKLETEKERGTEMAPEGTKIIESDIKVALDTGEQKPASRFVGVQWDVRRAQWRVSIRLRNRQTTSLGFFEDEVFAAEAYDVEARTLSKPVNFPAPGTDEQQASKSGTPPQSASKSATAAAKGRRATVVQCNQLIVALAGSPGSSSAQSSGSNNGLSDSSSRRRSGAEHNEDEFSEYKASLSEWTGLDLALIVYDQMHKHGTHGKNKKLNLRSRKNSKSSSESASSVASTSNIPRPDVVTYGALVARLGAAGRLGRALQVWANLEQDPAVFPDVPATNALLNAYAKGGGGAGSARAEAASEVLKRMPSAGLQPNVISYNSVLDAHARCGDLTSCAALLHDMVGATTGQSSGRAPPVVPVGGVMPNARTYSILMRACVEAQCPTDAAKILAHLQSVESRLNHKDDDEKSIATSHTGSKENKSSASRSNSESSSSGEGRKSSSNSQIGGNKGVLMANAVHYTTLIDGFGSAGQLDSAFECLRDMEARGLNANVYTWTSLIDACVKAAARAPHASAWRDAELTIAASKRAEVAAVEAETALMEQEMTSMESYPTVEEMENEFSRRSSKTSITKGQSFIDENTSTADSIDGSSSNAFNSMGGYSRNKNKGRGSFLRLQAARLRKEANALRDRANTLTASLQPQRPGEKLRGTSPSENSRDREGAAKSGRNNGRNSRSESDDQAVAQIIADLNAAFGSNDGESISVDEVVKEESSVARAETPATTTASDAGNGSTRSRETLLRLALSLFQAMLQSGVRPNKVTCTALMDGLLKCGELDAALELVEFMRHAGLAPSAVTFTALLTECARRPGHAKAAARLLRALDDDDDAATSTTNTRGNPTSRSVASIVAANLIQAAPSSSSLRRKPQLSSPGTRATATAATNGATTASAAAATAATPESTPMSLGAVLVSLFGEASRVEDAFFVVQKIAGLAAEASSSGSGASSLGATTAPATATFAADIAPAVGNAPASSDALDSSMAAATTLGDDAFQAALSTAFSAVNTAKRLDEAVELLDLLRAKNVDKQSPFRFQEASADASDITDGVEGFRVNEVTYAALLGACGRVKRLATAFAVFQRAKEQLLARHQAKRRALLWNSETATDSITGSDFFSTPSSSSSPSSSSAASPAAIASATAALDLELTNKLGRLYGSLVDACSAAGDAQAALQVFDAMAEDEVAPGVGAYTSLLQALAKDNDNARVPSTTSSQNRDKVQKQAMKPKPLVQPLQSPPTSSSALKPERGVLGLGRFLRDTAGPSSSTPLASPSAAASAPPLAAAAGTASTKPESRSEVVSEMASTATAVSSRQATATPAPVPQEVEAHLVQVFLLFKEMRARGVEPDLAAYNALMEACARAGAVDKCAGVLNDMVDSGLRPDVISYTIMIKAFGARGRVDAAEELFLSMQAKANHFSDPVEPNERTFRALMNANLLAGRPYRALALFDRCNAVLALKHRPSSSYSSATVTTTPSAAPTPPTTAVAPPKVVTAEGPASAAVAAASAATEAEAGVASSSTTSSDVDLTPGGDGEPTYMCASSVTYRRVLEACEQVGNWQRALAVCEGMVAAGVRLDNQGLLAATRLLDAHGQSSAAARVRRQRYDPRRV